MKPSLRKAVLFALVVTGMILGGSIQPEQALASSYTYRWQQGDPPVRMVSTNNSVCFLTMVQGKFQGGGEVVRVIPKGGFWYLEGKSAQRGVAASARCIDDLQDTFRVLAYDSYIWHQDRPKPTRLIGGIGGNDACFLSEVSGKFQGSGELLEIVHYNDFWWLQGRSHQAHVSGKAVCVYSNSLGVSPEYRWHQNNPTAVQMFGQACGLTRISGKFMGSGEAVAISSPDDIQHFLGGRSKQKSVQAAARCINIYDPY